jgi:hypothetical protein
MLGVELHVDVWRKSLIVQYIIMMVSVSLL